MKTQSVGGYHHCLGNFKYLAQLFVKYSVNFDFNQPSSDDLLYIYSICCICFLNVIYAQRLVVEQINAESV